MDRRFCPATARAWLDEGRTVAIEYRWAEGRRERFAQFAAEFVRLKVDVIVTLGAAGLAAKQVTSTIPIVFAMRRDPVGERPGRESRAAGRQRHRSVYSDDRSGRQATRTLARSCPWAAPAGDHGQWRLSRLVLEIGEVQAAARSLGLEVVISKSGA